jgi:KRAB domain-containing zinc finger protein
MKYPTFTSLGYVHNNVKRVDRKIACPVCGKMYSSNYCLTIHMGSMHSDEKQYQCEYCGMKFAWKKCYERHISSVHLQLKNYKCETCGTMFARKEHLRTHQKRHDREAK